MRRNGWSRVRAGAGVISLAAVLCNGGLMAVDWLALAAKRRPSAGTLSPTADFARRLAPMDAEVTTDAVLTFVYNGETAVSGQGISRAYHQHLVELNYALIPRLLDADPKHRQALALFDDADVLRAWAREHGYRVLTQNDRLAYLERE